MLLDPITAYDRLAPAFAAVSAQRKAYLDRVESLVIEAIPSGSHSLLDVGAGDGERARRIARAAGLNELTLLEPSAEMRRLWPSGVTSWAMRAEDLHRVTGQFDAITCLWNVIGHIFPASSRIEMLRQFARVMSPNGRAFIDLSHRYNASHYGIGPTLWRFLYDRIHPSEQNGDVSVVWDIDGSKCETRGHVFTDGEFRRMALSAGLEIERRFVIDYATGARKRWGFQGHLLYILRRRDR
jgi:SAM-dependent methyltransferase